MGRTTTVTQTKSKQTTKSKSPHLSKFKTVGLSDTKKDKSPGFFELALQWLENLIFPSITLFKYQNKMEKYFSDKNKEIRSLVRSAVWSEDTGGNVEADIAASPLKNDANKLSIHNVITALTKEDNKKDKITHDDIDEAASSHAELTSITQNRLTQLVTKHSKTARKVATKVTNASTNTVFELVDRKTTASQAFADLTVRTYLTDKDLGFFGFIHSPFATYRNWQTKQLVEKLRDTQHAYRESKNRLDPNEWQRTVEKYLYFAQKAVCNQSGQNDAARRQIIKSQQLLTAYNNTLGEYIKQNQEISFELIRNINQAIDELMDSNSRLKLEQVPYSYKK